MTKDEIFNNVIGHEKQKEDLTDVINWFLNSDELRAKGIQYPHGVILYGAPGNGKTFLMKKIIENVGIPTFVYKNDGKNAIRCFQEMYAEAAKQEKAIVFIDEIDLLIERDNAFVRLMQEYLDGLQTKSNVLFIAACNEVYELPDALLRTGRLEKQIKISYLYPEELIKMFYYYSKKYEINYKSHIDETELGTALHGCSCSTVQAICNDIVLRNGNNAVTEKMVFDSIYNVTDYEHEEILPPNKFVATHEAGHAVMARKYNNILIVKQVRTMNDEGQTIVKSRHRFIYKYEDEIARIEISLAGVLANKILYKMPDVGGYEDIQQARYRAASLINNYSCSKASQAICNNKGEIPSDRLRYKNEKLVGKLLTKAERNVKRYLRKNKKAIITLRDFLMKNINATSKEIDACLAPLGA